MCIFIWIGGGWAYLNKYTLFFSVHAYFKKILLIIKAYLNMSVYLISRSNFILKKQDISTYFKKSY